MVPISQKTTPSTGVPYVRMYNGDECADNVNNYLRTPTVRRVPKGACA